jgi:hypothetical protein
MYIDPRLHHRTPTAHQVLHPTPATFFLRRTPAALRHVARGRRSTQSSTAVSLRIACIVHMSVFIQSTVRISSSVVQRLRSRKFRIPSHARSFCTIEQEEAKKKSNMHVGGWVPASWEEGWCLRERALGESEAGRARGLVEDGVDALEEDVAEDILRVLPARLDRAAMGRAASAHSWEMIRESPGRKEVRHEKKVERTSSCHCQRQQTQGHCPKWRTCLSRRRTRLSAGASRSSGTLVVARSVHVTTLEARQHETHRSHPECCPSWHPRSSCTAARSPRRR